VSAHFPELGYYNTPSSITQQIAEAKIEVGDAIDEITNIAIELYDVLWRCLIARARTTRFGISATATPRTGSGSYASCSCVCSGPPLAMNMLSNHTSEVVRQG
jgi:hypothetical protein